MEVVFLDQSSFWGHRARHGLLLLQQSTETTYIDDREGEAEADRYAGCILPHMRHRLLALGAAMGRYRLSMVQQ